MNNFFVQLLISVGSGILLYILSNFIVNILAVASSFNKFNYHRGHLNLLNFLVIDSRLLTIILNLLVVIILIIITIINSANGLIFYIYSSIIYQYILLFGYNLLPLNKNDVIMHIRDYDSDTFEPTIKNYRHFNKDLAMMGNLWAKQHFQSFFQGLFYYVFAEIYDMDYLKKEGKLGENEKNRLIKLIEIRLEDSRNQVLKFLKINFIVPISRKLKTLVFALVIFALTFTTNYIALNNLSSYEGTYTFELMNHSLDLMLNNFYSTLPLIDYIEIESFNYIIFILFFSFIISYATSIVNETINLQAANYILYMERLVDFIDDLKVDLYSKEPDEIVKSLDVSDRFKWAINPLFFKDRS